MLGKITGGVAAGLMVLMFIFAIVAMAGPWWTYEGYGVTASVTLWSITMEGGGMSDTTSHSEICDDIRTGCKGIEDTPACEKELTNCNLTQGASIMAIFVFVFVLIVLALDITFAVLLCVTQPHNMDCCRKCPGYGGAVLTIFIFIFSIISLALAAGVDAKNDQGEGPELNGGGFVCMILLLLLSIVCIVLSFIASCSKGQV
jgi:hypothetical protein